MRNSKETRNTEENLINTNMLNKAVRNVSPIIVGTLKLSYYFI